MCHSPKWQHIYSETSSPPVALKSLWGWSSAHCRPIFILINKTTWHPCILYLKWILIIVVSCASFQKCCHIPSESEYFFGEWYHVTTLPTRHTPWSCPVSWVWKCVCCRTSELLVLDVRPGCSSGGSVSLNKIPTPPQAAWLQMGGKGYSWFLIGCSATSVWNGLVLQEVRVSFRAHAHYIK